MKLVDTNIAEVGFLFALAFVVSVVIYGIFFMRSRRTEVHHILVRAVENPILTPDATRMFENRAVFNPGAVYDGARVHLFYRALGDDGVSRIGYAVSDDGIRFQKASAPVFVLPVSREKAFRNPFVSGYSYNPTLHASGGGWGGTEDPRAVILDGRLYITFTVFENWQSIRIAVTSLGLEKLNQQAWEWTPELLVSPENETHKNWVMFPEKLNGKFAILHALTPNILIEYADSLEALVTEPIKSNNSRGGRTGAWDEFVRGAAAPPLKTKHGWLLLYHGMNPSDGAGYKVGAMLLDLVNPTKILYRSSTPILEPKEWYENDWKPGVVYASGAIVKDGTLFVYYGGGDKTVNVATAPLDKFLRALMKGGDTALNSV